MEFSKHNWATISETICPEMLIFGKYASWTFFFQNILKKPIIQECHFYDVITLVLYRPIPGLRHFTSFIKMLQFFAFLCKLALFVVLNLTETGKFTCERKTKNV